MAQNNIAILTMLDIGQGDAFAIDLPTGQKIVVDVGMDSDRFKQALFLDNKNIIEKIFNFDSMRQTIDLLFLSHDDADHAAALPKLSSTFKIGAIGISPMKYTYIEKSPIAQTKILNFMMNGIHIDFGLPTIVMDFLYPNLMVLQNAGSSDMTIEKVRSVNEHSLIMKFEHGPTSALFTGDAGIDEEKTLIEPRSSILKVGHHGSKTSTGSEFLEKVRPYIALISAGQKNKYGHPNKDVLNNLEKWISVPNLVRTDQCGTNRLVLYIDGAIGRRKCKV